MTTLAPSVSHRDPKGRKFVSIVETAYDKANLTEWEAQRVNNTPGLSELVADFIAENRLTDQFKDEEVTSNYGYLSGYKKPVGIEEQVDILRSYWPQLNPDSAIRYAREVYPTLQLPGWVEGPFAIIRPKFFSGNDGEEITEVLSALAKSRDGRFANYRSSQMDRFRRHGDTVAAYDRIIEQQNGSDILVVGSQFGIRHRGRSVRRAREVFSQNEMGLGAYACGIMILTHAERLQHYDDLWIDCAGDEFDDPDADVRFGHAPCFLFRGGRVRFGSNWFDVAYEDYGSVSAFVPPACAGRQS